MTFEADLNLPMWMRIAPELPLKTLVIGGFDKVFEIESVRIARASSVSNVLSRRESEFCKFQFYKK